MPNETLEIATAQLALGLIFYQRISGKIHDIGSGPYIRTNW
jgi:hypothetical protein